MSTALAAGIAAPAAESGRYVRHRPETTLLYRIVQRHYPLFVAQLAREGRPLPDHVQREFEDYLRCGRLEHGFMRVRCERCHAEKLVAFSCKRRGFCPSCGARRMAETAALLVDEVFPQRPIRQWVLSFPYPLRFLFATRPAVMGKVPGIVYRAIASHLIRKAGFIQKSARTGAVTLIQRFGSALNLNLHFHMLFLDGVYTDGHSGNQRFRWVTAPTSAELNTLAHTIALRVGRYLERQGLIERDDEAAWLNRDHDDPGPMAPLLGHSITYRIAVGPHTGRKVFTLQTLPAANPDDDFGHAVGKVAGFSLHAGVAASARERKKLDRPGGVPLCRYISRPAVSEQRLAQTSEGNIRYRLKTPYKDGTTHVIFEPLDFLAKLAALVRARSDPNHGLISLGSTASSHQTANNAHRSRPQAAARGASDLQQMLRSGLLQNSMPP